MRRALTVIVLLAACEAKPHHAPPSKDAATAHEATTFAPFHVTVGDVSRDLGATDLATVPMTDATGGKAQGWLLVDVLAIVAPGPSAEVTITGDVTVTLTAARLDAERAILRPNQKGRMVLDVFRGDERTDHVRDIDTITAR